MPLNSRVSAPISEPTKGAEIRMSYGGSNIVIAYNVLTKLPLDTIDEDLFDVADTTNNQIVLPWGGRWVFTVDLDLADTSDYVRDVWFYKNGSVWTGDLHDYVGSSAGNRPYHCDSYLIDTAPLSAGDTIDFRVMRTLSGSTVSFTAGCKLCAYYIPGNYF